MTSPTLLPSQNIPFLAPKDGDVGEGSICLPNKLPQLWALSYKDGTLKPEAKSWLSFFLSLSYSLPEWMSIDQPSYLNRRKVQRRIGMGERNVSLKLDHNTSVCESTSTLSVSSSYGQTMIFNLFVSPNSYHRPSSSDRVQEESIAEEVSQDFGTWPSIPMCLPISPSPVPVILWVPTPSHPKYAILSFHRILSFLKLQNK